MADREYPEGSTRAPTPQEVIRNAIEAALIEDVNTLIPAVVTEYDGKQTVSVKPLIMRAYANEDGTRGVEELPVQSGIPVEFIGAGEFRITCPISDGTLVINGRTIPATMGCLQVSQASLDRWLSGDGKLVDPEFDHHHALHDGVFRPGLRPKGNTWKNIPTDHMTIGFDEGPQIHLRDNVICIGDESGAKKLGLDGDDVDMGTVAITVALAPSPAAGSILTIIWTPPGGGPSTTWAVGALGPFPLTGKLKASATQGKGK